MSRLKMTQQQQEEAAVAKANQAKSDMTDEERQEEVSKAASSVAEDVAKTVKKDERPKKKATPRTPAKEAKERAPRPGERDPLEGVTVDPDERYPRILHMVVSFHAEDERTLDEIHADVKDVLMSQANAKLATVLMSQYAISGKHILSHHYDAEITRLQGSTDG